MASLPQARSWRSREASPAAGRSSRHTTILARRRSLRVSIETPGHRQDKAKWWKLNQARPTIVLHFGRLSRHLPVRVPRITQQSDLPFRRFARWPSCKSSKEQFEKATSLRHLSQPSPQRRKPSRHRGSRGAPRAIAGWSLSGCMPCLLNPCSMCSPE